MNDLNQVNETTVTEDTGPFPNLYFIMNEKGQIFAGFVQNLFDHQVTVRWFSRHEFPQTVATYTEESIERLRKEFAENNLPIDWKPFLLNLD